MFKNIFWNLVLLTLKLFLLTLRTIPRQLASLIARFVIWVLVVVILKRNDVGLRNLEIAFPEKSEEERLSILKSSYRHMAEGLVDFACLPLLTTEKAKQTCYTQDLEDAINKVRIRRPEVGVFCPTFHFGAYELVVQCCARAIAPVSILARGVGIPIIDNYINSIRALCGNEVFYRKGGYREIENRLSEGHFVSALIDQNVKRNHAVFVDFFGVKAATTKTVALAALRTNCPILFLACLRCENGTTKVLVTEIPSSLDEVSTLEEKVERITQELNFAVESVVRKYPEQWMWIHRRFKTRPEGELENLYSKSPTKVSTR